MLKIFLFLFLFTISLFSAEVFGVVNKFNGKVLVNNQQVKQNETLMVGTTIITGDSSKAIITQSNGNIITMGKNCTMVLYKIDEVEPKSGVAFFNILSKAITKNDDFRFKIKLKTASLGISGTNFIVSSGKTDNITLRKGQLDIVAVQDKFKIFSSKNDSFEKFNDKQKKEYEEFTNNFNADFLAYKKQLQFEFEQYAASFKLEEKTMIAIGSNNEVYKVKLNDEAIKNQFSEFDSFIDDNSSPTATTTTPPSQDNENTPPSTHPSKPSGSYDKSKIVSNNTKIDPNAIAATTQKTSCILQSEYKDKSQEELKEILITKAKAEALEELYGTIMKTKTELKNGKLISDEIKSLAIGSVRVEGKPEYLNGKNWGEVCTTIKAYITQEDFLKYQPKEFKLTNYCYTSSNLDDAKNEVFLAIVKLQRPSLSTMTPLQASDYIHGFEITNKKETSENICFDISANILPFEIDSFQELTQGHIVKDQQGNEIIIDTGLKATFYKKEDTAFKNPIASKVIYDNFDLMKKKFLVDELKSGEVYNIALEGYIKSDIDQIKNIKFINDVYSLTFLINNKSILKNKQNLYETPFKKGYNHIKVLIKTADYFDIAMFERVDKTDTVISASELSYKLSDTKNINNLK